MHAHSVDVIVAGAGIAGAASALSLAEQGLTVALIEPSTIAADAPPPAASIEEVDPRVSAISLASERLLHRLDAWSVIPSNVISPYRHMVVWEADGTGEIQFDATSVNRPQLGYIIENRWIVHGLISRLMANRHVQMHPNAAVTAFKFDPAVKRASVMLSDGQQIAARLIVAADGARSTLRDLAGIETDNQDTGQSAIVTTAHTALPHRETAWQNFLPTGPLAFLPLGSLAEQRASSIVWSAERALATELMAHDEQRFCRALERGLEQRLGRVQACSQRYIFPLYQRHARSYFVPGLVLIGDAAHAIHPLAGQGINLGLSDVAVLSEEIARARHRETDWAAAGVLARYQRRRIGENALMLHAMTGFRRLFGANQPALRLARNFGLRMVNNAGAVKKQFIRHAMGI